MDLVVDRSLVGRQVSVPARPDWGAGKVLRVQTATVGGQPQHRVTVQFPHGIRTLVIPPAKLAMPQDEVVRKAGWLDQLAGRTLDDRLQTLPEEIEQVLGTPRQRLAAIWPLYAYTDEPQSLMKWARWRTGVADPLSHWSRDELGVAFQKFCLERDAHLRNVAAILRMAEGHEELRAEIEALDPSIRPAVQTALARPI